ncbi:MAG: enoyl-CoA hydratase/isomerase family protein, partial [Gammaproteobacteria bacterium]|nr:enoyl-CoA hydratase/isomerase family protein [Gammaproteobacteria bacterium]
MTDQIVKVSVDDDIASIILDRGEARNALNRDTMTQLRDAALTISDQDQVRAVIIRAEGTD